jgi:hypothetical protein
VSDDIAYLAVYLASDESSWVTGQNICVDGGVTAGWRDDAESDRTAALCACSRCAECTWLVAGLNSRQSGSSTLTTSRVERFVERNDGSW